MHTVQVCLRACLSEKKNTSIHTLYVIRELKKHCFYSKKNMRLCGRVCVYIMYINIYKLYNSLNKILRLHPQAFAVQGANCCQSVSGGWGSSHVCSRPGRAESGCWENCCCSAAGFSVGADAIRTTRHRAPDGLLPLAMRDLHPRHAETKIWETMGSWRSCISPGQQLREKKWGNKKNTQLVQKKTDQHNAKKTIHNKPSKTPEHSRTSKAFSPPDEFRGHLPDLPHIPRQRPFQRGLLDLLVLPDLGDVPSQLLAKLLRFLLQKHPEVLHFLLQKHPEVLQVGQRHGAHWQTLGEVPLLNWETNSNQHLSPGFVEFLNFLEAKKRHQIASWNWGTGRNATNFGGLKTKKCQGKTCWRRNDSMTSYFVRADLSGPNQSKTAWCIWNCRVRKLEMLNHFHVVSVFARNLTK